MANINWDIVFHIDPMTLEPAPTGVPVPTYGNYGGAGYSEGAFGPPVFPYVAAVDTLDELFLLHDVASFAADTAAEQAAADLGLLWGIVALKPGQLDAEASLYGGFATLAMIQQLAASDSLDLLSPRQLVRATRDAVQNIERGLTGLDFTELLEVLDWLGDVRDAFATAGVAGAPFDGALF